MIALDVFLTILLFAVFAVSHTLLASLKIKKRLAERIGSKIAFYRFFYNLTSVMLFVVILSIAPKTDMVVYDLQSPYDIITFALQVLSLIGLIWAAKPISLGEFIGVSQIERYLKNEYVVDDLDERQKLDISGAFRFVRHPIYFFLILFLGIRPTMSLFYLVMFLCITIYCYVGSIYEEKKLVELFGAEYVEYQKSTPRIFPIRFRKRMRER
jgi:methanethiol S-methyltransferase